MRGPHIRITRLPDEFLGCYDSSSNVVWLDDRLTPAERRCTLEHELVHAERGDTALPDRVANAKQEQLVHREASRRLIPIDQLGDALRWTIEARELAECLEVDLATLQTRLNALGAAERAYLEEIASRREP